MEIQSSFLSWQVHYKCRGDPLGALPNMGWRFQFQPHGFLSGSCTSRVPLRLVWSCAYNIDAHVLRWRVFYGEKGRDVSSTWNVSACRHIADTSYDAMHISKKCKQNVFQYRVILFDEIQFDPICFLFLMRHASARPDRPEWQVTCLQGISIWICIQNLGPLNPKHVGNPMGHEMSC